MGIWVLIPVIFLASLIKGTTGFGFALMALPVLVHFYPVKNVIPLLTLFNFFSSVLILYQHRHQKITLENLVLPISGLIGVMAGLTFFYISRASVLKLTIGIILSLISLAFLLGYRIKIKRYRFGSAVAGLLSGFLGGSLSVSGPPLALFLTSLNIDNMRFRFIFAIFSIVVTVSAMAGYIGLHTMNLWTLKHFAIFLPLNIAGVALGKKLAASINVTLFYKVVLSITLISGILLVIRNI